MESYFRCSLGRTRHVERHKFKMESCLRGMLYALRTRNTYSLAILLRRMLFEWQDISPVFFFSLHCSLLSYGYSKILCRHKRGTKPKLDSLHKKSTLLQSKIINISALSTCHKQIAYKCCISSSFNRLVQTHSCKRLRRPAKKII